MFDPMQAYLASENHPIENNAPLDEEQYALRHGHVVRLSVPRNKLSVELGKFLIRTGEKLAGEHTSVEFSGEIA